MTTTTDAAQQAGATFRQLDYWIRRGYIQTTTSARGSGYDRDLAPEEVEVLKHMTALTRSGLQPAAAAEVARQLTTSPVAHLGSYAIACTRPPQSSRAHPVPRALQILLRAAASMLQEGK